MTTTQIQTFLTAAASLNFSAAAERLYISQATVSRQIQAMETELQAQLFLREGNSLSLTVAGMALQKGLSAISGEYLDLCAQVKALSSGSVGLLRLGLMEDQQLDGHLLKALEKYAAPRREVTFVRMELLELRSALREGKLDAACMIFQDYAEDADLCRLVYAEEPLCLVAHRKLQFGSIDTPEQLAQRCRELHVPLLMPETREQNTPLNEMLARIRRESSMPANFSRASEWCTIEPTVASGFAVTCTNASSQIAGFPELELYPLAFLRPVQKGLLWARNSSNPAFAELLKYIRDASVETA